MSSTTVRDPSTFASLVIYHRGCPDGVLAASIAAKSKTYPITEFLAWDWKDPLPSVAELCRYQSVIFLDCAPSLRWVASLASSDMDQAPPVLPSVVVLDHHQTTKDAWDPRPEFNEIFEGVQVIRDPYQHSSTIRKGVSSVLVLTSPVKGAHPREIFSISPYANFQVYVDVTRAGCQLAWDYFRGWEGQRPWYVEAVADRDLWTWRLPTTRALTRGHNFLPADGKILELDDLDALDVAEVEVRGAALLEEDRRIVASLAAQARPVRFTPPKGSELGPSDGMLWEAPADYDHQALGRYISDVGNVLAEGVGFSVQVWRDGGLSFRSCRTSPTVQRVDVMAKFFGGGGHPNAAGAKTGKTFEFPGSLLIAYPELFSTR